MKFKFFFLSFLAVLILAWYTYDSFRPPFKIGEAVPDFALTDVNGKIFRLSDFVGQPVLIHFWATWCGQCVEEMPLLSTFYGKFPEIKVLSVSEDESGVPAVKAFFSGKEPLFPVLMDTEGHVADLYKSYKVPESYLIDREGKFLHRFIGSVTWNNPTVQEFLKKLLKGV